MLGVGLGLGLSGVQLFPSHELYSESVRANGVTFEYINLGGAPRLLQVFFNLEYEEIWHVMSASRTVLTFAAVGLIFAGRSSAWAAFAAAAVCVLYGTMPRWFYDAIVQHVPIYNGVRVEAGRHTIEMRYAPASLRIGAAVSGGSVLIVLAISMGVLLHSRRRARSESAVTSA